MYARIGIMEFSYFSPTKKSVSLIVNIVIPKGEWILAKIGQRTAYSSIPGIEFKVSFAADAKADVNFYCDIQNCYWGDKTKLDIGYLTHADKNSRGWLKKMFREKKVFQNLDGIVSMNERYTQMAKQIGYPKDKIITLTPGQTFDSFKLKDTVIGIVSRGGFPGYGQQFMERLFKNYDLSGFKFRFLGNGWENVLPIAKKNNVEIELLSDKDYSIYPKFYQEIDYLLIPGLWTAGPMSFQEALATGTPVISSDVGFAGYEFKPDYIYPPSDEKKLYKILSDIRKPIIRRRKQVENMSWEKYSNDVVKFFKKMQKLNS